MRVEQKSWLRRLQAMAYQETSFLPKRLVLFTLLLLGIYTVLLIRTAWRAPRANMGLIEARLASELVADYQSADPLAMAFAPLSLGLVNAKIRDENPYLSEAEVASLVEMAIAAANQPIIAATPTPGLRQSTVIQSALVIAEQGGVTDATQVDTALEIPDAAPRLPTDSTPLTATPYPNLPSPVAVAVVPTPTDPDPITATSGPTQNTASAQPTPVSAQPTALSTGEATPWVATAIPSTRDALPTSVATSLPLPSPTATFADPTISSAVIQMTATPFPSAISSPSATATSAPTNAAVSSAPASTLTAATATSPAANIATSTATNTAISLVPSIATSTPTQTTLPIALPSATNTVATAYLSTPTVTPAPTVIPPPPTLSPVPTMIPSPTPTPLPTATASPTTPPVIATLPAVINVKARVEGAKVYLEWSPIASAGLVGYNIYRSHTEPVELGKLVNSQLLVGTSYVDTITRDGSQSFYVVTAVNQLQQESLPSLAVTVNTPDLIAPNPPMNFALRLTGDVVQIQWQANQEADLAGYNVYRSNQLPVDRTVGPLNGTTLLTQSVYQDTIIQNGQTYYYIFTAVDLAGNESLPSIEAQIPTMKWDSTAP